MYADDVSVLIEMDENLISAFQYIQPLRNQKSSKNMR